MTTPIYGAVEWSAAQASPWVPHNAALRLYEAAIRGSVLDRDLTAPPGTCDDGACYLVAATATGAWATYDGKLAVAVGTDAANGWLFATIATEGQFLFVEDEAIRIQYIGAAWVTANLTPAWGDIGGEIADQTDLTAAIAASGGNTGGSQQLNGVVSGLGVNYVADLDFEMSAGSFYLDSTLISAAAQTISLDAADGTHARIDVLYVDDTGTLGKITGTASASPSQPSVDPTTQLYLTFVLVPAAATSLGGISNVDIYREGTEWSPTTSGTGFTVDSTNNPYAGTKCIEGTAVAAGAYVKMVAGAPITFDGDGNLTLRIRSKASWNSKRWLTLQWYASGVAKGSQVSLKSGSFGFSSSITADYQLVVIPKALFQVVAGADVDELRIADVGGSIGFYLDEVILQTTGDSTGSGGQVTGISQADADARYARRSLNLSDLTDAAAARTNIDVYSTAEVDALAGGGGYTDEQARDAIGTALVEGTGIDVTVDDGGDTITITNTHSPVGAHQIYIPAGAMKVRTTNGAAAGSTETTTNKIMVDSLDFDQSTQEYAQFSLRMPKSWNEGTVTMIFVWTATATGNVIWGGQGVAISNDDVLDAAFGTAAEVTDSVTAANDLMESAATSAITIGGTPAEGDWVVYQVYRKAADGGDTVAADAKLLGVVLTLTTNAATDA